MAQIVPNIIILGIQGSGKSTQAEMLARKFDYNWIIAGQLVRNAIKKQNQLSKTINDYVKKGKLVPHDIMFKKIFRPYLEKIDKNKGIIFDGIPRDMDQMKSFHLLLEELNISQPYLIYLKIPDSLVLKRILARRICPICDKTYKPGDKIYDKNICPKCNVKLTQREDDVDKKALEQRLSIFHKQTKKIIAYYKKNNLLIEIDGKKIIPEVYKEIIKKINQINVN